jgi:hypothetical protein
MQEGKVGMMIDELENELRNLKLIHLTEGELLAYCDQELDQIARARAEVHLKHCFICERQLELLREETAALTNRLITSEDVAFVERLMDQTGPAQKPFAHGPAEIAREVSLRERLAEYLRQMIANWQIQFKPVRRSDQGEEVWRWQSADGYVQARAIMEKNADLTIHFSSNEMILEGTRLSFRLGSMSQELTLRRISESEVAAQVAVPPRCRQGNMADISIEIV